MLFEPWRYEKEEHLLLPLLVEFHARIFAAVRGDDLKRTALNVTRSLLGRVARGALRTAGRLVERHIGLDPYEIGEEFLKQYGEQQRDWSKALSEVEGFKQDFRELIEIAMNDHPRPVVVLIDDLDRCSAPQVRQLLESIKLFLHVPGVFFFLALDHEQVLQAMAEPYRDRFKGHPDAERRADALAEHYLEKFFQHSVDVSAASSVFAKSSGDLRDRLWAALAGRVQNCPDAKQLHRPFEAVKSNPRALKRVARWLYFESHAEVTRDTARRFAEQVLAVNWPLLWVSDFLGDSAEGRRRAFAAAIEVCDLAGITTANDLKEEAKLAELQTHLQAVVDLVSNEAPEPLSDDERDALMPAPRIGSAPDTKTQQMTAARRRRAARVLATYPTLIETLKTLSDREADGELARLWQVLEIAGARDGTEEAQLT